MGKLFSFSSARTCRKHARLQIAEPNQHVRRSWVNQFERGKSVMALARQNKAKMQQVENEIREALWRKAA
jgi:hypothetical protein